MAVKVKRALLGLGVGFCLTTGPAHAGGSPELLPPSTGAWSFTVPASAVLAPSSSRLDAGPAGAAASSITCDVTLNSPHYSDTTPGVIAKARVSCFGSAGSVVVKITGSMGSVGGGTCSPNQVAAGPPVTRWSGTSDTKTVVSNGGTVTYYLPPVGAPTLNFNASWYGTAYSWVSGVNTGGATSARYTGPSCP